MCTLKYIERLDRIDQFIRQRRTGSANEFADRLGISRRQLFNLLDELKDFGLPVVYSRSLRTFMYESNCRLNIKIEVLELDKKELSYFDGGNIKKLSSLLSMRGYTQKYHSGYTMNTLQRLAYQ